MSVTVGNKYEIIEKIGEGTFGKVFKGRNIRTNDNIAIKIQYKDIARVLRHEAKIYKYLSDISGIPQLRSFGIEEGFNFLVLDLFDISLEVANIRQSECIECIISVIDILKHIHDRGVIHRDIKPDNFLFKMIGERKQIYLIDFGLSKMYVQSDGSHILEKIDKKLIGTATYSSLNMHNNIEPSRRDDMESICYTFISLYGKPLPWSDEIKNHKSIDGSLDKVYEIIKIKKEESLAWLYDIPGEFLTLLLYCRKLGFSEKPNYAYMSNMMKNLLEIL